MKRVRPRLSYANVVATLALFLALGGGAVWAAGKITSGQIGKGAVKNKNLAKNAVKAKNIAKNAVTADKLKAGAVNFDKLATGTNVVASATAGPVAANQASLQDLPLSNPVSVTPAAGQPLTLNVEVRGSLTATAPGKECIVIPLALVNGAPAVFSEFLALVAPSIPPNPIFPNGLPVNSVSVPIGLSQAGQAQTVTMKYAGDVDCTAASKLDQAAVVITRAK